MIASSIIGLDATTGTHRISCDHPGCGISTIHVDATTRTALREARGSGWIETVTDDYRDYCPDHAALYAHEPQDPA